MFVSQANIEILTGYRRPSFQIKKLRAFGIRFFVAADGYPRVLNSDVEASNQRSQAGAQPDFEALKTLTNI